MTLYQLFRDDSEPFNYGRYRGTKLEDVVVKDPLYIIRSADAGEIYVPQGVLELAHQLWEKSNGHV